MVERADIKAGLKNAVERGYSLDFAKQSFINAGYSATDVEDSAAALNSPNYTLNQPKPYIPQNSPTAIKEYISQSAAKPQPTLLQQTQQAQQLPQMQQQNYQSQQLRPSYNPTQEPKKSTKGLAVVIILGVILLLLVGALMIVLFKKEWILSLLESFGL